MVPAPTPAADTVADPPIPESVLWQLLLRDPRTGIHTIDLEGRILYVNQRSVDIYVDGGRQPGDIIGRTLSDVFLGEFAEEREQINRDIIAEGKIRLIRAFWRGQQYYILTHPHGESPDAPADRATSAVHQLGGADILEWSLDQFGEIITPSIITLGPFSKLTRQELVVLALLGRGLSLKAVAAKLHRSVKTVQTHRDSIGQKLGVADRGELIAMVQNAGLEVADAFRTRAS
jgi:DNA-binding CsgD family transcriptional regulator